jgi:hypothetical protein
MAPGVNITSTGLANGTAGGLQGTSFASPHAAGCAALLIQAKVATTPDEIEAFLKSSPVEVTDPKNGLTFPRIDCSPAVDVYLLVDLSGSFGDDLPVFKAQAPTIISTLKESFPNIRFGLGSFEDYPIPPFGDAGSGDVAYRRNIDLTFDTPAVEAVISGLFTRFGDDTPQSQLPALFQAATGEGQDLSGVGFPGASIPPGQQANFRTADAKLFLLWTDASFHQPGDPGAIPYPGPSFGETVDAILALDPPQVIGISSGGGGLADLEAIAAATNAFAPPGGVDCDGDGQVDLLEGDPRVCTIAFSGQGISEAIIALVEAATIPEPTPGLTALSPAKVWVGLKNSDAVGLRLDLKAEVFLDDTKIGEGQLNNVSSGSSGFNNAKLNTIPLTLFAPVEVPEDAILEITVSVRRTCFGGGHNSGTPRLWYNDSQANSRFGATIEDTTSDFFLRDGFALATTPGPGPKKTIDVPVDNKAPCPDRPFKPFGTWSIVLP